MNEKTAVQTIEKPAEVSKPETQIKTVETTVQTQKPLLISEQKPVAEQKAAKPVVQQPASEQKPVQQKPSEKPSTEFLLFNKWSTRDVRISDTSLSKYINLSTRTIPHSFGTHAKKRFEKNEMSIVERLVNKVMRSGQGKRKLSGKYIRGRGSCGKKLQAIQIVEDAFTLVERQTKQNPIQILVKAIENSGPREDTTRIKRGGISYTVSVDVAPMNRVDESLKNLALAGFSGSFNKNTSAAQALAKELIAASKEESSSLSVKRRDEVERIAKSSR